jgi:hypothetical protein
MLDKKNFNVKEDGIRMQPVQERSERRVSPLVEASSCLEDGAKALIDVAERLARAGWSTVFVDLWLAVSVS